MERASGRVMGPVGGQHRGGIGGTLAVRGREWQHLAEYDFSEGGSHRDISVYEYLDFRACRLIEQASPERKLNSIATVIRTSRKQLGWLILDFLGRAAHAYSYLQHYFSSNPRSPV